MTIYGKGCISNYRNCSLSYVWYSVLYRMLTPVMGKFKKPVYDDKTRSYQINWNDMVYLTESLVISQISMPKAV